MRCRGSDRLVDSGHARLAHAIEASENHAYVHAMTNPDLPDWADEHGFGPDLRVRPDS
jgi:hypothetical protein